MKKHLVVAALAAVLMLVASAATLAVLTADAGQQSGLQHAKLSQVVPHCDADCQNRGR